MLWHREKYMRLMDLNLHIKSAKLDEDFNIPVVLDEAGQRYRWESSMMLPGACYLI